MSTTPRRIVVVGSEVNLEFLIALLSIDRQLPVVLSLFNENIAPHLQAANHLTLSMTAIADEPVYRAMPSVAAAAS